MKRYMLPLRWRLTLAAVTLGLGWAAHVWPQSEVRLLLTVLMITVLIAGARYRGEWWF
jgi:hypothetical protein